ncbi:MAG: methyltransferase domain-containing protein [Bacteroidota bacterium]
MSIDKCRLCGSESLKLYYTQGNSENYRFYKCSGCGLVNYDMSTGLNQEKYAEVYLDPDADHVINKHQKESFDFIKKEIPEGGKYLDIGCGNAGLLLQGKKHFDEVEGLELSGFLADEINKRHGINVHKGNFLEMEPGTIGEYDFVTLRHVLEHLPDPHRAMDGIYKLLKPGGKAMMEFPNIEGLSFKLKRALEKSGLRKKKYNDNYVPGHVNEYSKKPFIWLCGEHGFKLLKWTTYSSSNFMNGFYSVFPISTKARVLIEKISK